MLRNILLSLFITIVFFSNSQVTHHLVKETITQHWILFNWRNSQKEIMHYNKDLQVEEKVVMEWRNNDFENSYKTTFLYDNGNVKEETSSYWNITGWEAYNKISYSYDATGKLVVTETQEWFNGSWKPSGKTFHSYNGNNLLVGDSSLWWNDFSWEPSGFIRYDYDQQQNLEKVTQKNWNGSSWEPFYRTDYSYDADKNRIQDSYFYFDWQSWVEISRTERTFEMNRVDREVESYWDGYRWRVSYRYTYNYDNNGLLERKLGQSNLFSLWVNQELQTFFYDTFTNIEKVEAPAKLSIYPNPVEDAFTIKTEHIASDSEVVISDFGGKIIACNVERINSGTIKVSGLQDLPAGIYLLKLSSGNGQVIIHKFIKRS